MSLIKLITASNATPLLDMYSDPFKGHKQWARFGHLDPGETALFRLQPRQRGRDTPVSYVFGHPYEFEELYATCARNKVSPVLAFNTDWMQKQGFLDTDDAALRFLDNTRRIVDDITDDGCPLLITDNKLLPQVREIWRPIKGDGTIIVQLKARDFGSRQSDWIGRTLHAAQGVAFGLPSNTHAIMDAIPKLKSALDIVSKDYIPTRPWVIADAQSPYLRN